MAPFAESNEIANHSHFTKDDIFFLLYINPSVNRSAVFTGFLSHVGDFITKEIKTSKVDTQTAYYTSTPLLF